MSQFDPTLFADIADSLRLPSPAFIEKDYYAVQLLKSICSINLSVGKLVFAVGTCLPKAHLPTFSKQDPISGLVYGLQLLQTDIKHKQRYAAFLGPLVYNRNPPSWEDGIERLGSLSKAFL